MTGPTAPARAFRFPALLAAYPALFIAANNTTGYEPAELLIVLPMMLLAGWLVCLLVYRLRRSRAPRPWADALIALLVIAWLTCLPTAGDELRLMLRPTVAARWRHVYVVSLLLLMGGIWTLNRLRRDPVVVGALARRLVYVLAVWAAFSLGWHLTHRPGVAADAAARAAPPIVLGPAPADRPDVYLIILDEYARADVLADRLGITNQAFEDSLRALGFVVPRRGHSNYTTTLTSVAALLNLADLDLMAGRLAPRERNPATLRYLIEHNRLFPLFATRGYTTWYSPSSDFLPTRHLAGADSVLLAPGERPWRSAPWLLSVAVWEATLPGSILKNVGVQIGGTRGARRSVERFRLLPGVAGHPRLVFAHLMLTHAPFYFAPDCGPQRWLAWPAARFQAAYLAQLECTNRLVLEVVTRILAQSAEPPVIILQGDHGTGTLLAGDASFDGAALSPAQARERLGAFGAYYLPGNVMTVGDSASALSVLRGAARVYAGARLEPEPDLSYFVRPGSGLLLVRTEPLTP